MTGLGSHVRALWLRHGEKALVGLAGFAFLYALFGTQWRRYERDPYEARKAIAAADQRIAGTPWPAKERESLTLAEGTAVADLVQRRLREPLDSVAYFSSQKLFHRLGAEQRPLLEPVLYPVQEMIVSTERVLLPQIRNAPVIPLDDDEPTAEPEQIPDEFLRRGIQHSVGTRLRTGEKRPERATRVPATVASLPGPDGRGYPYVAVRGCVDLPQQIRAYVDAIHTSFARAEQAFEIIDFQMERQTQLDNAKWSAWEPVNRDVYFDVLRRTGGLAHDVVSADATDSAITAPLPTRITGVWSKQSTHPRLARYDLSPSDLAQELKYLEALSKRAAAQSAPRSGKRGFAEMVQDTYRLKQSVFGAPHAVSRPASKPQFGGAAVPNTSRLDQVVQEITRELDPQRLNPQLVNWIRARATAQRRMLLFRYLDFDVMPGETYRYRVRLEVRNPNYGQSLARASTAGVILGATRFTPWSEPTTAVEVEPLAKYFVTDLAPSRKRAGVEARMHVYQYDVEAGTTIEQDFRIACGQKIGGAARTTRPNPVKGLIEEGLYNFRTSHTLVDGIADLELSPAEHPDLQLPRDSRGRAYLANMYVITGRRNDLQVLDSVTQSADFDQQKTRMQWQATQLEPLLRAGDRLPEDEEFDRQVDL